MPFPLYENFAFNLQSYVTFGGLGETRTPVCNTIQSAFYMFILIKIFSSPKWKGKPKTTYILLNSLSSLE